MADKQKTIDIIFGAVDKTGSTIQSVGSNISSLESNISSISGPLAGVADNILKLDAVLAAAAIGLTAYSIKLSDEFGTAFAEISTLIGQPASSLQKFKDDIQSYSEQSTSSLADITQATYNAISAGVDYADSLSVLEQAEALSIAGRADLDTTTRALVSTLNAYGAEMSEAEAYSDSFFTIVQKGQTTLPELADSIGQVAPLASQAGISFDELGAAIAAVTAGAGVSTSEAVTALRAAISALIKPTKDSSDLAKELGIDFNSAALASKGLEGVLREVGEATGGNVEQIARLFPNVRSLTAVLPLTGAAADEFSDALQAMKDKQDITSRSAKELELDLGKLSQTLKNNVTSSLISFGDNFSQETASIIQSLSDSFGSIGSELRLSDGAFAPLIGQLEGVFQEIESKFAAIAENLPEALKGLDFSSLVGAFDDLGKELGDNFQAIFGNVDISTVEGLEKALQTVVDAFTALVNITSGIVDGLEPLFELIGAGASEFSTLSADTKKAIGEILGLAKTVDSILPAVGALGSGLQAVGIGLTSIAGVKTLGILSSITELKTLAAGAGKGGLIGAALFGSAAAGAGIGTAINELFESVTGNSIGTSIYDWINGDENSEALKKLENEFSDAAKAAEEYASGQGDAAEATKKTAEFVELDIEALNKDIAAKLEAKKVQTELVDVVEETGEAHEKSAGTLSVVTNELNKAAEATKEVTKESDEYRLKLLEIASDERIANIEAKVSLDIAALEADTDRAVAIINNLGTTIQSTGELVGSLFGTLQDASGSRRFLIERQIALENENRKKALDQQERLTQAQINLLKKKAQQISKGESIIKVSAEGLTPALELIFNEVLEFAQVRANEQGLEFLTGV